MDSDIIMEANNSELSEECEQLTLFHSQMKGAINDLVTVVSLEDMLCTYKHLSIFKNKTNILTKLWNKLVKDLHKEANEFIIYYTDFYDLKKSLKNLKNIQNNEQNELIDYCKGKSDGISKKVLIDAKLEFKNKLEELVQQKEVAVQCLKKDVTKIRENNYTLLNKIQNYRNQVSHIERSYSDIDKIVE